MPEEPKKPAEQAKIVAQKQDEVQKPVQRPFIYDELKRVKNNAGDERATKLGNTNKQE